jgi:hypothetical protein
VFAHGPYAFVPRMPGNYSQVHTPGSSTTGQAKSPEPMPICSFFSCQNEKLVHLLLGKYPSLGWRVGGPRVRVRIQSKKCLQPTFGEFLRGQPKAEVRVSNLLASHPENTSLSSHAPCRKRSNQSSCELSLYKESKCVIPCSQVFKLL